MDDPGQGPIPEHLLPAKQKADHARRAREAKQAYTREGMTDYNEAELRFRR